MAIINDKVQKLAVFQVDIQEVLIRPVADEFRAQAGLGIGSDKDVLFVFRMTQMGKKISTPKMDIIEHVGQGLLIYGARTFETGDQILMLQ